jgi:hypothetical protein
MSLPPWHEEPISKKHDRESFDCGEDALNDFLRRHARKSHHAGGAKTFVAIDDKDGKTVLRFYTHENDSNGILTQALNVLWRRCGSRSTAGVAGRASGLYGNLLH